MLQKYSKVGESRNYKKMVTISRVKTTTKKFVLCIRQPTEILQIVLLQQALLRHMLGKIAIKIKAVFLGKVV